MTDKFAYLQHLLSIAKTPLNIILIFGVVLFSCSSEDVELRDMTVTPILDIKDEEVTPSDTEGLSFLALGDSYTIGTGISKDKAWPYQLKEDLIERSIAISDVKIIAKGGWTTANLLEAMENENVSDHDLVSLMIGVNNQFQKLDFSIFKSEFILLLEAAIDLSGASKNVFVVSIPDYGVTLMNNSNSTVIGYEINMYNNYIKEQCAERNIVFIDVTGISRDLGASNTALASDGLHPSAAQYAKWTELMGPVVEDLINE